MYQTFPPHLNYLYVLKSLRIAHGRLEPQSSSNEINKRPQNVTQSDLHTLNHIQDYRYCNTFGFCKGGLASPIGEYDTCHDLLVCSQNLNKIRRQICTLHQSAISIINLQVYRVCRLLKGHLFISTKIQSINKRYRTGLF